MEIDEHGKKLKRWVRRNRHFRNDTSTGQGYVYILGKQDAAYPDNIWIIYGGVEGKWFHA